MRMSRRTLSRRPQLPDPPAEAACELRGKRGPADRPGAFDGNLPDLSKARNDNEIMTSLHTGAYPVKSWLTTFLPPDLQRGTDPWPD